MADINDTKKLLDEINAALASYDPILREHARDILLRQAFGLDLKITKVNATIKEEEARDPSKNQMAFHELIEKWTPATQAEWALLGAYYSQVVLGNESVTALQVNKELKKHGAPMANITSSFDENIKQNPALMRQISKSGKSQQAKKKYIVTTSGIKFVEGKLSGQQTG